MQFKLSTVIPAAALILAGVTPVLSDTQGVHAPPYNKARSHRNLVRSIRNNSLEKRGGVPATYYDITTGEVACGGRYSPGDHVVAMNTADFGGGSACGKQITINYQGKSISAIVRDMCPGCGGGGIDMTQGLFTSFAPTSVGELFVEWHFGGGGGGGEAKPSPTHKAAPPPPPKTTSTHHYEAPPTTHTTSTHQATHSTTSTSTTTRSSSSSTSSSSSSNATPSSTPSAPSGPSNIAGLYQAIVQLGKVVVAGVSN